MTAPAHTVLADADGTAYASLRKRPVDRAERYALGKRLRDRVPRKSLGDWSPPVGRPTPCSRSWTRTRAGSGGSCRYASAG